MAQNKYGLDGPSAKFNQRALLPQLQKTTLGMKTKAQYRTGANLNRSQRPDYQNLALKNTLLSGYGMVGSMQKHTSTASVDALPPSLIQQIHQEMLISDGEALKPKTELDTMYIDDSQYPSLGTLTRKQKKIVKINSTSTLEMNASGESAYAMEGTPKFD